MNVEQMRIRMGEMAAEIDRLNADNDELKRQVRAYGMTVTNMTAEREQLLTPPTPKPA